MKRLTVSAMLVAFLTAAGAVSGEAQSAGLGGLLDWIHRLSGPQFAGAGVTAFGTLKGESHVRARLSVVHRRSFDEAEEVVQPDVMITMWTVQPTIEFPLQNAPLELAVGVAFHRFQGDVDPFWHYSVPVLAQVRLKTGSVFPRFGLGIHIFPAFGPDDFSPLTVDVSRDKAELVLQFFLGIDVQLWR
ncbi:MAG: hypothetical protein GTO05_15265 [Gemmatimonadales bacterium]|nr:hypothetical protein [Gemmatimonadales bacterium]